MTVGFYGKLASRGDFIHRGLPSAFIESWDAWLATGIATSQQELGPAWLDAYLVSPLWRFALAPGLVSSEAVTGVMMPSVDRVGRYFPLTIACLLDADADLGSLLGGPDAWYEQAEALLLSTLEEGSECEAFEAAVAALGDPPCSRRRPRTPGFRQMHFGVASPAERLAVLAQLTCEGASLWWGRGSEHVAAGLLCCAGMPAAQAFSGLLLGADVSPAPSLAAQLQSESR
ncbi:MULTISPECIES: type VI secretion system-associated protein TagF [Pseudomonadaceae]|jgi:type VI secretion system protein ImpM|uniref:Type VI secretion system-associated protein TagF n=1 Tax=Ectopseudomonas hydrolytica TaxID=2493633 RepID=A0ABY5AEZ4_9GAMM|nr:MULTISPECIES: type VI secretion system-associated protein TagF [Pseudomonas]EJO91463.1 type VI secretion-associated protein TagF [Pseudomonas mendocina DLHK]MBF8163689.1 type VI secretion system-associated protein TagF [Pseudomonas mendocina]MBA4244292.1 type VI secretion system-associated protein TagF [Pseudomonas sp.]MDH0099399.1 type VI secretion system-associated protein TagF [Pseudomonas sp. GD04158]USR41956.1 type VI secretion system-associated protein TagF [Pseudomonas hydrolytica]